MKANKDEINIIDKEYNIKNDDEDNTFKFGNSLDINSKDKQEALKKYNETVKKSLIEVGDILEKNNDKTYIDPKTGDKIVNANDSKIWFAQNIVLIFSYGAVFDKNDREFLNMILSYFDNKKNSYLPCAFKTYSYDTDIIKKFENLEGIGNGNYHICCFVICYADESLLKFSPEPLFSHRGICESLIETVELRDEIIRFMEAYGFTKQVYYQPASISKISERDDKTCSDIKFNYNKDVDYNSPTNRELFNNLKDKDEIIGTRTRINGNVDGRRSYPRKYKNKNIHERNSKDLAQRITLNQQIQTFPTDKLGGNVKINNDLETRINSLNKGPQKYNVYKTADKQPQAQTFGELGNEIPKYITDDNNDTAIKEDKKYNILFEPRKEIQTASNYANKQKLNMLNKNYGDFAPIINGRR